MVNVFTSNITEGIDEIAPVKTFTVKTHHKFGLSDATKKIMSERDNCRIKMKNASSNDRKILHTKYKTLRNKVTASIRKDNKSILCSTIQFSTLFNTVFIIKVSFSLRIP